jgi:hypothetical protein
MKLSKKILILVGSLFAIIGITTLIAWATNAIFGVPMLPMVILLISVWIFGSKLWDKWVADNMLQDKLKELIDKKYRDYLINLPCQHCATMQPVVIDLDNSEFQCIHCKKTNAVLTNITTAEIIPELDNQEIFNKLSKL